MNRQKERPACITAGLLTRSENTRQFICQKSGAGRNPPHINHCKLQQFQHQTGLCSRPARTGPRRGYGALLQRTGPRRGCSTPVNHFIIHTEKPEILFLTDAKCRNPAFLVLGRLSTVCAIRPASTARAGDGSFSLYHYSMYPPKHLRSRDFL